MLSTFSLLGNPKLYMRKSKPKSARKTTPKKKSPNKKSPIAPHFHKLPLVLQNEIVSKIKKSKKNELAKSNYLYLTYFPDPAFHVYSLERMPKLKKNISVKRIQFGKVYKSGEGNSKFNNIFLNKNNKVSNYIKNISVSNSSVVNNTIYRVSFVMNEYINEQISSRQNTVYYGGIQNNYVVFFRSKEGSDNFMKALRSKINAVNNSVRFSLPNYYDISIQQIKLYKNYSNNLF